MRKRRASSLLTDVGDQPKSDYTYSASLTYRQRVTPDRKIGSPNMSRRTLKGGIIGYAGSPDFTSADDASHTWDLRSRTILKPMDAFSDSDGEERVAQPLQNTSRSRRSTRSRSIDVPQSNGSLTRTITTTSTEYINTRTALHHGLDAESDVDDNTESAVPVRATPLLARGGTPLGRATTPLKTLKLSSSRRSSFAMMDSGKGYTIGEGTIAEDVEEEEEIQDTSSVFTRWSRKTVLCITQITTIVTASIAMMATRAITASSRASTASSTASSTTSSKEKLVEVDETASSVSTVDMIKSKYNAACDHIRKNPILLWIPPLFLLLLLALASLSCREHDNSGLKRPLIDSAENMTADANSSELFS